MFASFSPALLRPLFTVRPRPWLWSWLAVSVGTVATALTLTSHRVGSWAILTQYSQFSFLLFCSVLFSVWSLAGAALHRTLLNRPTWTAVYFGGTWALFMVLSLLADDFILLVFPVIMQSLVFRSLTWSCLSAALFMVVTLINAGNTQLRGSVHIPNMIVVMGILVAFGGLFTVLLMALQKVNEQARLRDSLIRQLRETQQSLSEREREAGMLAERTRLSRELHDTLAQGLAGIVTQLSAASLRLPPGTEAVASSLQEARDLARASLHDIRSLVWALRPAELGNNDLESALSRLTTAWAHRTGISAHFERQGAPQSLRPEAEVALLRINQEALSNAASHAQPSRVVVQLIFEEEFVMLDIRDDGVGFDPEQPRYGLGLLGIRERVEAFSGHLLLESGPFEGTSVTAVLPLAQVSRAREVL